MDLIIRFFVWVANCFLSGKAQAFGFALIGAIVSYGFIELAPIVLKGLVFIYPNLGLYIANHMLGFQICFFTVYMAPVSFGCYLAIQQLKFIYYKENFRHY